MTRMEPRLPRKLLVVRLGAIGDVVNALCFATALKDHAPATEIAWAVHPLAAPLVAGHPSVDRAFVWERGGGFAELRRLVRALRAERFELAVDLQRIQKSAWLARSTGAPRVLGYDRRRAKEQSWIWTNERIPPGDPAAHMVEQYLEFARWLGVPAPRARHVLPRDEAAEDAAEARVAAWGGAPILVNVGATKPANRWPAERFGVLAAALARELDLPVCLTGGPGDRAAAESALAAGAREAGVHDLVGATDLRALIALERRARLWIGCDTGPMHVAAACGTPVVALFGPADPRRTGPFGPGHRVVRVPPSCAPCNRKTCNQPRHACMEDITPERVLEEARAALGQRVPGT